MPAILLVDDEEEICAACAATLREFGFMVDTAHSADAALRLAQACEYDAVLIEFNLRSGRKQSPRSGKGIELVRRLRAAGVPARLIVLTAMEGDLYRAVSLEAGADSFVGKADGLGALLRELRAPKRNRGLTVGPRATVRSASAPLGPGNRRRSR